MDLGRSGYTLLGHPLFNAWTLANEPGEGEIATCIVQPLDVTFKWQRHGEAAMHASGRGETRAAFRAARDALGEQELSVVSTYWCKCIQ